MSHHAGIDHADDILCCNILYNTGNQAVCELFVKCGANVDMFDECGRSAAWYAMDAGHTAVKQTIEPSEEDEITNLTLSDNNNVSDSRRYFH